MSIDMVGGSMYCVDLHLSLKPNSYFEEGLGGGQKSPS